MKRGRQGKNYKLQNIFIDDCDKVSLWHGCYRRTVVISPGKRPASDVERWETAVFLGQTDNCCIEGVFFNRFIFTAGDVGNHFDYYWSGSLYHSCDSCYFPCEYIKKYYWAIFRYQPPFGITLSRFYTSCQRKIMVCLCRRSDTPTLRRVTPARPFLSKCCETRFPSPILSGYPHDTGMTLIRNELIPSPYIYLFVTWYRNNISFPYKSFRNRFIPAFKRFASDWKSQLCLGPVAHEYLIWRENHAGENALS